MGWNIQCCDSNCGKQTWALNIVDLIQNHTDEDGWFRCSSCGGTGYIEKSFGLQEPGHTWEPFLKGVILLGDPDDTYQPFVFLVSYKPNDTAKDVWFSYYKDLRETGGRLKLGYGPGGPPVLGSDQILELLKRLIDLGFISFEKIRKAIDDQ